MSCDTELVLQIYRRLCDHIEPGQVLPMIAFQALSDYTEQNPVDTSQELMDILNKGAVALELAAGRDRIPVRAGTDLYLAYITRLLSSLPDSRDFKETQTAVLDHTRSFVASSSFARSNIARLGSKFVANNKTILIHGSSRCVIHLLMHAASEKGMHFRVYVTESRPHSRAREVCQDLAQAGIETCILLDTAVGYVMQQCDVVFAGAESICENGGALGAVGTYQIGILCKQNHILFYIITEACKFVRYTPLSQNEIVQSAELQFSLDSPDDLGVQDNNPNLDYTPPDLITGFITDLGIIPPSGVSEELLRRGDV